MGKVLSIQIGPIREIEWEGKLVESAIFKNSVSEPILLTDTGLNGDRQAEKKYHGGTEKAIYSYASEYYPDWQKRMASSEMVPGSFGENLFIEGFLDNQISPDDIFQIGSDVQIQAVQPRIPCFKIGMRFGDASLTPDFIKACRYGVYYRVLQTGIIQEGDTLEKIKPSNVGFSIEDMSKAYAFPKQHVSLLRSILDFQNLDPDLREDYEKLLRRVERMETNQ
jgi:MOSC domain-containing protein YiiM